MMKLRITALAFVIAVSCITTSNADVKIAARSKVITANDGFPIISYELYESRKNNTVNPKAVFFYIQGSEQTSVLSKTQFMASAVIFGCRAIMSEKRGCYPDSFNSGIFMKYSEKQTRVSDHIAVINSYLENIDKETPVIIVGNSEGGDIAAVVANKIPQVSHLILMGSAGGWSQYSEIKYFIEKNNGYLDMRDVTGFDSLVNVMNGTENSMQTWAGLPYKRWNSYLFDSSITYLQKLDIPILLLHGSADKNVPVEAARAVQNYFYRNNKPNLKYIEYKGVDHTFTDTSDHKSRYPYLEIDMVNWFVNIGLLGQKEANYFTHRIRRAHKDIF